MNWVVPAYCLVATACLAQQPALRVIPDSPRADLRAYLEIDLPPCRVQATETTLQAPLAMAVRVGTRACAADATGVGKTVVPLGIFPQGEVRLDIAVDGAARSLAFRVGTAQFPYPEAGSATARMERVDRALVADFLCGQGVDNVVNDTRTEVEVNIVSVTTYCPGVPPIALARIGFPRMGHHVIITRRFGVITGTQWIVVEKGFDKLDYSDLWSVQGEDGWGVTIQQHDKDRLFAVIYGYRTGGRPIWISLQGPDWETATRVRGSFLYSGGTLQSGPYQPPGEENIRIHTEGTIEFLSADTAVLTLNGSLDIGFLTPRTWTIKRLVF